MRKLGFIFLFVSMACFISAQQHSTKRTSTQSTQQNHQGHNHDHGDHSGHNHAKGDHSGHNHAKGDHSGHNHAKGNHSGHNHAHGDHSGHNHAHGDHSGHNHAKGGHDGHAHGDDSHGGHAHQNACGHMVHDHSAEFNPGAVAFHHISDQNVYSIGPIQIPLPCILYTHKSAEGGSKFDMFSSGKFKPDYHGNGSMAYNGYVLYEGSARRVRGNFNREGLVELKNGSHSVYAVEEMQENGKKKDQLYLCQGGQSFKVDSKSTLDGGLFGGGITSFTDFSITKNVVSMLLVSLFLFWLFRKVARAYKTRKGMAPTGVQGFLEPIFVFIQDEVAKPFLGKRWEEFIPILMALFFFILGLNLFGQVPFFGGSNVTGSLSVTAVLAIVAFLVTTKNGNKDYWKHIFNMPGLPAWVKVIVTPVEMMGAFIVKPLTLMLRLFGNMTAGHMVIVIFVGLIFIFGKNGMNPAAGWGMVVPSALLTMFMMAIELLVAFIQAFVFTILTASYIGAATEEHHH